MGTDDSSGGFELALDETDRSEEGAKWATKSNESGAMRPAASSARRRPSTRTQTGSGRDRQLGGYTSG